MCCFKFFQWSWINFQKLRIFFKLLQIFLLLPRGCKKFLTSYLEKFFFCGRLIFWSKRAHVSLKRSNNSWPRLQVDQRGYWTTHWQPLQSYSARKMVLGALLHETLLSDTYSTVNVDLANNPSTPKLFYFNSCTRLKKRTHIFDW